MDKSSEKPVGYAHICHALGIEGLTLPHRSYVAATRHTQSRHEGQSLVETYPNQYWPGDSLWDHLEFALKYDGVSLLALDLIFAKAESEGLAQWIQAKPTGKYARRIWFFYEYLTDSPLPIPDATTGNYIPALEPELYVTVDKGQRSTRHRVVDNLLGPRAFCPIVRRTEALAQSDAGGLRQRCEDAIADYPPELLRRALSYLYTKETKSSFAIERVEIRSQKAEAFMALLARAEQQDFCTKERLIALQNSIVDPRFQDRDYRESQSYVGQTLGYRRELIHYVCPKPGDLASLMAGFLACHQRMSASGVDPIVHAAVVAYGFVFLHPFEDGNGRIHRFLIHNVLAMRGMIPQGMVFPVSAVMLKDPARYDASLEAYSRTIAALIDYTLDDERGEMTVHGDTARCYEFMDLTAQAEALLAYVVATIDDELVAELGYLVSYDACKKAMDTIVEMPDRKVDLFISLCRQNGGKLSPKKARAQFGFLTPNELAALEAAVEGHFPD